MTTEENQSYKDERSTRIERDHLLIAAGVILVLSGLWLGYFIGHQQGLSVVAPSISDLNQLNAKISQQQATMDTLTRTLSATVKERDIALTTSKGLTDTLAKQTADRAIFDARYQVYRDHLLDAGGMALALQNVAIIPISQSVFEYHIDLMQLRKKSSAASGTFSIRLIQGDRVVDVPLSNNRVNLTDFQSVVGRWTMPTGFTPEFIEISVSAGGQSVEQRFAWEGGAPQTKTLAVTPSTTADQTAS